MSLVSGETGETEGCCYNYLDLFVGPAIHTQRLDLGDVGAQLPVDRSAPHAEKDAQLKCPLLITFGSRANDSIEDTTYTP